MEDLNDYKLLVLVNKLKKESSITFRERIIRYFALRVIPENSKKYLEAADECLADVLIVKKGIGDLRITPKGREQIAVLWRTSMYCNVVTSKLISYISMVVSILALAFSVYSQYYGNNSNAD